MAKLSLQHVAKVYADNVRAVNDFNLDIDDKEFIVFVGPSGCGKSTTLRMVAGLEDITEGQIYIDDKLVNDVAPKDRDIAMVFQNYALYPHMSVYENMAFALTLKKVPKTVIDTKVREAAKILDIEHLLDRKPKALSGGQRQRVALGRAIVRSPKVFLMDEPLSNLDAKLRVQMRIEIAKLHKKLETTFIYVTHDQTEAMTMGTRIVVMKDGIINQCDAPQEIYNHPVNKFVAGFIGSPQMNFLDGKLVEENGELSLSFGSDSIILCKEKINLAKLSNYINKEVIMGIRPEHIQVCDEYNSGDHRDCIEMVADVCEHMGAETYIYLSKGLNTLTIRVNGASNVKTGDQVKVIMEQGKICIFDKENEITIL